MRRDYFSFDPTFKLFFAGNHRPGLRDVDEAMRRRIHLVPFRVTIAPEKRDPELPEKLAQEFPRSCVGLSKAVWIGSDKGSIHPNRCARQRMIISPTKMC